MEDGVTVNGLLSFSAGGKLEARFSPDTTGAVATYRHGPFHHTWHATTDTRTVVVSGVGADLDEHVLTFSSDFRTFSVTHKGETLPVRGATTNHSVAHAVAEAPE